MAEVKLYIFKGTEKGEGISLTKSGDYSFDKSTILPPKTEKDETKGLTTLISTTITNSYALSVSLLKLEYRKKIYKPCDIFAKIQTSGIQMKTTKVTKTSIIDQNGKELESKEETDEGDFKIDNEKTPILVQLFKGAKVVLEIDGHTVAENYFVFNVRTICNTNSTSIVLRLSISSADKLMDLDKYSRAYTAKRLYTDILSEESKQFKNVEVENHMQLMKYKDSAEMTARDELRIPYVVQYNESFYHFMARTANRFGEFLYFEDGKLNLGMQPSEQNYYKKDSDNKDVVINWATEPNAVQSLYFDSEITGGITVNERAYDFTSHTPNSDTAFADSTDSRYNFDPVSTDEWTNMSLKKNEYLEFKEILGEEMKAYIPEFIFKALEMTTLGEALVVLLKELSGKIYEVWNSVADYNNVLDDSNYNSVKNDDQKSYDHFTEFATYAGSTHLKNNLKSLDSTSAIMNYTSYFYPLIRNKEREIDEKKVFLDFGNNYKSINLGDRLYVSGKDYVAISIEGSYGIEEDGGNKTIKEHLLVSAVPVMTLDETNASQESTPAGCDVWTNILPFPPLLSDAIIRDARPQVAFVAENLDPQNLGRIRVRYPWQDETGDASPWIRVTLPLATAGGAVNFTPSIGDEVMVGYEHGNIDRPYAMGYLTAPFVNKRWSNAIPLDQYGGVHGIKTKTGHHLTFSDGYAFAPLVANTFGPLAFIKSLWPVGKTGVVDWPYANETTQDFGGGFELSDRYGFYKIKGSTDERSVTIESPAGTVEVNAFQGITINAPNGDIAINGKNVSISASNKLSLSSGENIKNKLLYQKKWGLKDDGFFGSTIKDIVGSAWDESVGQFIDMSFVRCVLEYFLHPVNGTLQIKSYTFVSIEAGDGATEAPQESFRYGRRSKKNNENSRLGRANFEKVTLTVKLIQLNVKALLEDVQEKYDILCECTAAFNAASVENIIAYETVIQNGGEFDDNNGAFNWAAKDLVLQPLQENNSEFVDIYAEIEYEKKRTKRQNIINICNNLRTAAIDLKDAANKWKTLPNESFKLDNNNAGNVDIDDVIAKIKAQGIIPDKGIISLDNMINFGYDSKISKPNSSAWKYQKKVLTRLIVSSYLTDQNDLKKGNMINTPDDAANVWKWGRFARSIEWKNVVLNDLSWVNKHVNPFCEFIDDQVQWTHGVEGTILMSNKEHETSVFNDVLFTSISNRDSYDEGINNLRELVKKM